MTEEFGKAFIFEKIRPKLRYHLLKAGITEVPYSLFGWCFHISAIITLIIFILIFNRLPRDTFSMLISAFSAWFIIQLIIVTVIISLLYGAFSLKVYNRTKEIERVLPDYLQFVEGNLRGGMSIDKALWSAVKPRFSILAEEIKIAAKKVMTGGDTEQALLEFTEKYESPIVRRSFLLIIEGIKGGGALADLINKVIKNINETRNLKQKMVAATTTFTIFISAIVIFIAPMLFALSYNLLIILQSFAKKIGTTMQQTAIQSPINFSNISITPENFKIFAMVALGVIALFSSMIIAILQRGDVLGGIKYIPIFIIGTEVLFIVFITLLTAVFGGIVIT